jgi:hypothetical protein
MQGLGFQPFLTVWACYILVAGWQCSSGVIVNPSYWSFEDADGGVPLISLDMRVLCTFLKFSKAQP